MNQANEDVQYQGDFVAAAEPILGRAQKQAKQKNDILDNVYETLVEGIVLCVDECASIGGSAAER